MINLSEFCNHAKFDIYNIYSVWENNNVKVFATYGHLDGQPA